MLRTLLNPTWREENAVAELSWEVNRSRCARLQQNLNSERFQDPRFNLTSDLSLTVGGALPPLPTEEMIWKKSSSFRQHFSASCNTFESYRFTDVHAPTVVEKYLKSSLNSTESSPITDVLLLTWLRKIWTSLQNFHSQADEKERCLLCRPKSFQQDLKSPLVVISYSKLVISKLDVSQNLTWLSSHYLQHSSFSELHIK